VGNSLVMMREARQVNISFRSETSEKDGSGKGGAFLERNRTEKSIQHRKAEKQQWVKNVSRSCILQRGALE